MTTKKRRKSKKKNSRFTSYAAAFIWIGLFVFCIGIYVHNNNQNNTVQVAAEKVTQNSNQNQKDNSEEIKDDNEVENKNDTEENTKKENVNEDNEQKSADKESKDVDKETESQSESADDSNEDKDEQLEDKQNTVEESKEDNKKSEADTTIKNTNSEDNNDSNKQQETTEAKDPYANIEKVTFNPENRVVVIDPGHADHSNYEKEPISPGSSTMKIKDGGGTSGQFTGTPEYVVNMEVSMRLKDLLEQKGFTVVMTKTEHNVSLGNVERAVIGNEANAALVIRVHADGAANPAAHGASMLVPEQNEFTAPIYDESKRCGKIVIDTLCEQVGMYNRGLVYRKDITGFNWSEVPVVLVEMGFMTNEEEDTLLSQSEYQDKLAKGLADGIEKALQP